VCSQPPPKSYRYLSDFVPIPSSTLPSRAWRASRKSPAQSSSGVLHRTSLARIS
jgi:hypothetical protein